MEGNDPNTLLLLVAGLGLFGGIVSGVLGIGGGILMAPLLLYVPPACRQPALGMQVVAGLTIVQSLFAGLSGAFSHHRRGKVHFELAAWLGGTMLLSSFAGAWWSGSLSNEVLLAGFGILAFLAAVLMLLPPPGSGSQADAAGVIFAKVPTVAVGAVLGFFGGMVGQSGAFMVIPAMIHILKIPVRTAIGTTLAVVVMSAVAGSAGKLAAGQVVLPLVAVLLPPAVIGARIGARWSASVRPDLLRYMLAAIIAATSLGVCYDLLSRAA